MSDSDIADEVVSKLKGEKQSPESVRRKNLTPSFNSPTDVQANLLLPQTGRAKIGDDLSNNYKVKFARADGSIDEVDVWNLASSITSDTRMSNLDPKLKEYAFVQWGMDIQTKCLMCGLMGSSAMAQMMVLSITEPTMGKNMAFFKNIQTVRQESQHVQVEETKKSKNLFGFISGKKE